MRVLFSICLLLFHLNASEEKVLICGICKNVAPAVQNSLENIELLGSWFADYRVIIYENNSEDNTPQLFSAWAEENDRVTFISEIIPPHELGLTRLERIAAARNRVLTKIKDPQYSDFAYVVMADLDFFKPWPVEEIHKTISHGGDWDAVFANGVIRTGVYYDRLAFRDKDYPFGPELLGDFFWKDVNNWKEGIRFEEGNKWSSVFSAFGGLGIYKRSSLLGSSYSGVVTEDLKRYYEIISDSVPESNFQLKQYRLREESEIVFIPNAPRPEGILKACDKIICCEHVTFHAAMALQGFGKFYVNPKMKMYYYR